MQTADRNGSISLLALIVTIALFGLLALGGLWSMSRSLTNTNDVVDTLQYGALRGDCIREITADVEQQFRIDLTELITVGRSDPAQSKRLIERMNAAAKVNYADTVKKKCPPAVRP